MMKVNSQKLLLFILFCVLVGQPAEAQRRVITWTNGIIENTLTLPTPSAPTAGVVDNTADTLDWTNTPGYTTVGAYEQTTTGTSGTITTVTAKPISVGNVAKAVGQVCVRVKAVAGVNNASTWLCNATAFTVSGGGGTYGSGISTNRSASIASGSFPSLVVNQVATDATFGLDYVTVARDDTWVGGYPRIEYAQLPNFNLDSTRIWISSGQGNIYVATFNPTTMQVGTWSQITDARAEGFSWSGVDPNLCWFLDGTQRKLIKLNVSTGVRTIVKDFGTQLDALYTGGATGYLTQTFVAIGNDSFFTGAVQASNGTTETHYLVYNISTNTTLRLAQLPASQYASPNDVHVSPNGRWIWIISHDFDPSVTAYEPYREWVYIIDAQTNTTYDFGRRFTNSANTLMPFGHMDVSDTGLVGFDTDSSNTTTVLFADLLSGGVTGMRSGVKTVYKHTDYNTVQHYTWKTGKWALLVNQIGNAANASDVTSDELLLVDTTVTGSTNSTGSVRRLQKQRNVFTGNYNDQSQATISPDGQFLIFHTNNGFPFVGNTPGKHYVIVTKIPVAPQGTSGNSGSVKTDLTVYYPAPSIPSLPSAGSKAFDPVFGTEILRLTDANTGGGAQYDSSYSYWISFNSDNSKIKVWSSTGGTNFIQNFDPATFTAGTKVTISNPPGGSTLEDAVWSQSDPDALFQFGGSTLYKYRPSTGAWTSVASLASLFPAGTTYRQVSHSNDDNIFAFSTFNSNGTARGYAVYKNSTNALLYDIVLSQTADSCLAGVFGAGTSYAAIFDEVQIDKSGRYLTVKTGNSACPTTASAVEVKVVDLQASGSPSVVDLTNGTPDYSPGHSDNGSGIVVGAEDFNDSLTVRSLATPHTFTTLITFGFKISGLHVSMQANNENWVMISDYGQGTNSVPGYLRDEIFFVKTDGSGAIRRILHHYSVWPRPDGTFSYYESPRANVSRDGKFVAFTSNMGVNNGRRDLYIAKVPDISGLNVP